MKTAFFRLVVALLMSGSAWAAPRAAIGTVRGFSGQIIEVPLSLRYGTNDLHNVVALQADVSFEGPATPGVVRGGSALRGHVLRIRDIAAGTQRMLAYSLNNAVLSNGVIATIPFSVAPGTRSNVRLTLNNVILSTADGAAVPVTAVSGAIVINPVYVRPDNGNVDGYFSGLQDETSYVVQATTNFLQWINVATNAPVDSFLEFIDLDAHQYPYRFYRPVPLGGALAGVVRLDGSLLSFRLLGVGGRLYVIQASTNLFQWTDLTTNTATSGTLNITNAVDPAFPQRFFRLKSAP